MPVNFGRVKIGRRESYRTAVDEHRRGWCTSLDMGRGARLRKLRETFDLTQEFVIAHTLTPEGNRVSVSTYKRAEVDDPRSKSSMDTLKGIAAAFDVRAADLDDYLDGKIAFEAMRDLVRPHVEQLQKIQAEQSKRGARTERLLRTLVGQGVELAPGLEAMADALAAKGMLQGNEAEALRAIETLNQQLLSVYRERTSGRHRVR